MKRIILIVFLLTGSIAAFQPIQIIDKPTAGLLNKKVMIIDVRSYSPNALLADFRYSPFSRLQFGFSYGATDIIGSDTVNFNGAHIGLKARFRPLEEGIYNPAIAVGVNTQGYGPIVADSSGFERFLYPSEGGYIALSKSFMVWMFTLGIHGVVNYTFERENLPSFFSGLNYSTSLDFGVLSNLYLLAEYDFKQGDVDYYGNDNVSVGLLNIGARWNVISNFSASFHVKDMLGLNKELSYDKSNGYGVTQFDREFRLTYFNSF